MGIETAIMAVGVGLSAAGAASGASAQRRSIALQNQANAYQAASDRYNARASALAMHGQADLDDLSAQAEYRSTLMSAEFNRMQAGMEAFTLRNQAVFSAGKLSMQADEAEGQAHLLDASAEVQEVQAQLALMGGERGEQETRMRYAHGKSQHTARMAAGNIALDEGTALEARTSYDVLAQREVLDIRRQATMAAWGHRMEGAVSRYRAGMQRGRATLMRGLADLEISSANARANYVEATADNNAHAARALAEAGLTSANANSRYRRDMADIEHDNAMVDIRARQTFGHNRSRGPSAGLAAGSVIVNALPGILNNWHGKGAAHAK